MKSNMKYILLLIVIGIGAFGYYNYTKPLESVDDMATDVSLSSDQLLMAFESNETQANADYLDKVLSVSGNVGKVENKDGKSTIYLETENDLSYVICQLDDSQTDIPQVGSSVHVKGICSGYLMDVVVVRGIID